MHKQLFITLLLSCATITPQAAGMHPRLALSRQDFALSLIQAVHREALKEVKPLVPTSALLLGKTSRAFYKFLRWAYRYHKNHPAYERHLFPQEGEANARE